MTPGRTASAMNRWDGANRLLQGERLVCSDVVPYTRSAVRPSLDDLVKWMTNDGERMPLASFAFPTEDGFEKGEGLFRAEFGRDALVMAAFAEYVMPQLTETTVRRLAELQGVVDASADGRISDAEEVGRIPHEARPNDDPIALEYSKLYGWQWPYFGSVDATPLFISAADRAIRRDPNFAFREVVQRDGTTRTISETVIRAVNWMVGRIERHPANLLESSPASNGCWQVWMDSIDAYHHSDGRLARGAVAAVEVQAWAYDALVDAMNLMRDGYIPEEGGSDLEVLAERVQRSVVEKFFVEEKTGAYFASGVERLGEVIRPLKVRSGNMGMLLNSRILEGTTFELYVDAIVSQLFDENGLWCYSGIRTLSMRESRFRPFAYHNGSVWPWQNLWIGRGLRRHRRHEAASLVENRMIEIAESLGCYPEFVQGGDETTPQPVENIIVVTSPDGHNGTFKHTLTQPAQKFQGWTAFGLYALEFARSADAVA